MNIPQIFAGINYEKSIFVIIVFVVLLYQLIQHIKEKNTNENNWD